MIEEGKLNDSKDFSAADRELLAYLLQKEGITFPTTKRSRVALIRKNFLSPLASCGSGCSRSFSREHRLILFLLPCDFVANFTLLRSGIAFRKSCDDMRHCGLGLRFWKGNRSKLFVIHARWHSRSQTYPPVRKLSEKRKHSS